MSRNSSSYQAENSNLFLTHACAKGPEIHGLISQLHYLLITLAWLSLKQGWMDMKISQRR
jgi:hypothetical protein